VNEIAALVTSTEVTKKYDGVSSAEELRMSAASFYTDGELCSHVSAISADQGIGMPSAEAPDEEYSIRISLIDSSGRSQILACLACHRKATFVAMPVTLDS
jgi:hypothetical protein